uniref:Uncharacterized protein n=1 Tax=Daphnia galeata TaxID=27404 RepID=A0A8J2RV22_9CRUS|nr:unnamed protein product [Daphnia galeata]
MGRLRRGHSLEVIFEEETTQFQPSIARLEEEELTDEWKNYRRLSRRQILFQQQEEFYPESSSSSSVQVTLCSQCCLSTEMDSNPATMEHQTPTPTTTTHIPARRRNSTYLALACANAVSQGAMTRSLRQMFETQPVRETQPLLSRAEIKQQIQAARLRRNSIAVLYPATSSSSVILNHQPDNDIVTAIPAVVVAETVPTTKQPPPTAAKPTTTTTVSPPTSQFKLSPVYTTPVGEQLCIRCDKCSSILTSPPVAVSVVINNSHNKNVNPQEMAVKEEEEKQVVVGVVEERTPSPTKIIPTNREVVEEELPKPDTVKNARCLFESSFMEANNNNNNNGNFSTLQHVKSNPSSKILRSESSMTLDRAGTRSSSVASRPPFRWPSRQEHARNRSPSPSPSPSPIPALIIPTKSNKTSSTLPSYYRSSPSLTQYRSSRHSLHSTDVESYVSEGGSDCWSSDLESEASYSSSGGGGGGGGRDDLSDSLDGMRYISPDVMEKIRSYGMTLTFVNGKMVDEDDDDQEEPEVIAKEAATRKVVQSIRSAGQSELISAKTIPPVAPKKTNNSNNKEQQQPKPASPQPRIVACLPKQETEKSKKKNINSQVQFTTKKIRHSSGESSASSGVSSGTNAGSDSSSEHNSPFASLKRTKSANADHTVERSPSPGPRQSGTRKDVGSSPFGCYSVVYSFNASARSPMYV